MITFDAAKQIALKFLKDRHAAASGKTTVDIAKLIIDEKGIIETSFGWLLPFDDRRCLEEGDYRYQLAGNQPLVVLRRDGTVMTLPTLTRSEYEIYCSIGPHGSIEHRLICLAEKLRNGTVDVPIGRVGSALTPLRHKTPMAIEDLASAQQV